MIIKYGIDSITYEIDQCCYPDQTSLQSWSMVSMKSLQQQDWYIWFQFYDLMLILISQLVWGPTLTYSISKMCYSSNQDSQLLLHSLDIRLTTTAVASLPGYNNPQITNHCLVPRPTRDRLWWSWISRSCLFEESLPETNIDPSRWEWECPHFPSGMPSL